MRGATPGMSRCAGDLSCRLLVWFADTAAGQRPGLEMPRKPKAWPVFWEIEQIGESSCFETPRSLNIINRLAFGIYRASEHSPASSPGRNEKEPVAHHVEDISWFGASKFARERQRVCRRISLLKSRYCYMERCLREHLFGGQHHESGRESAEDLLRRLEYRFLRHSHVDRQCLYIDRR